MKMPAEEWKLYWSWNDGSVLLSRMLQAS